MYPPHYCSGDSHEYPGYQCSICNGASSEQSTMIGSPINNNNEYTGSVYQEEWWPVIEKEDKAQQLPLDLNTDGPFWGEHLKSAPQTFLVPVDEWPRMYWSRKSKQYMWEANCKAALPECVVRIPHEFYVNAKYDGAKYYLQVVLDKTYLSKTRQPYVVSCATNSTEGI